MDAVATLHGSNPPLIHRDLKLENLLINSSHNGIKLCDFGSATSETFHPNIDWTMNQVCNEQRYTGNVLPEKDRPLLIYRELNSKYITLANNFGGGNCKTYHPNVQSA